MNWNAIALIGLAFAASAQSDQELLCADTAVLGFKWDEHGETSEAHFRQSTFTIKDGPAQGQLLITETSEGRAEPRLYHCRKVRERTMCRDDPADAQPWMFDGAGHYARAFLAGGPPGSRLDPNIAIAYGTCAKRAEQ